MRITIERSLFDVQSQGEAVGLTNLLISALSDLHNHAFLVDPIYGPASDNAEIDVWLSKRPSFEADAFRALLVRGILVAAGPRSVASADSGEPRCWNLPGPLEIRVARRLASDWRNRILTVADAVDLLREPVHLVLENERTELVFVRHLADPANRAALEPLLAGAGRISAHGGGTGEVKKWIEALTSGDSPAEWRRMLRAWVLFDRDAGTSDACTPSKAAIDLMQSCEAVVSTFGPGLSWICLGRRELESFVPDSALLAHAGKNKDFVEQVIGWRNDPVWKRRAWALDLKKGLHGDLRADLSAEEQRALKDRTTVLAPSMLKAPFATLSHTQVTTLSRGLGDVLGKALRAHPLPTWVSELPAEYDRGPPEQPPRVSFVQSLFDRM